MATMDSVTKDTKYVPGDWNTWNNMSDTQRLMSWREACDRLAEYDAVAKNPGSAMEWIAEMQRTGRAQADALAVAYSEIARLRAALQLIATPLRPDGTWNRSRAACMEIAQEALSERARVS